MTGGNLISRLLIDHSSPIHIRHNEIPLKTFVVNDSACIARDQALSACALLLDSMSIAGCLQSR
jgi:hypothetical protein